VSEQPAPSISSLNQLRARIGRFSPFQRQGMFGLAEIFALVISLLILIMIVGSYFYFLVPARSRLAAAQAERSRLQNQLRNDQDLVKQGQSTEATVEKIAESLDTFENRYLLGRDHGRTRLYDVLNELITKDELRNTSGPAYTTLEPAGSKTAASGSKSANAKWQSIYPGISINLTVEGQYQSLRRFVRDLEASKQFIIINAVELERSTEANTTLAAEGSQPAGPRPSLISLRLDMATYFNRSTGETSETSEAVKH